MNDTLYHISFTSVISIVVKLFLFIKTYSKSWEKAMAPHSSTVARKIPWIEEPGRL